MLPLNNHKPMMPSSIYYPMMKSSSSPHNLSATSPSSTRNKKYFFVVFIASCLMIYVFHSSSPQPQENVPQSPIDQPQNADQLMTKKLGVIQGATSRKSKWFQFTNPSKHSKSEKERNQSKWKDWSLWNFPSTSRWFWKNKSLLSNLTHSLEGESPAHWQTPTPSLPLDATLDQRLHAWRTAPIPEPAIWVQFNLQTCPDSRVGKNANYDLLKRAHLMWATMNSTHVRSKREEMIGHLEESDRFGLLDERFYGKGKGIVFTAGNVDTYSRVFLTVRMLREHLNCQLPVEIFSFPAEKPDQHTRKQMEALNVKFLTVDWAEKDSHRNKNFVDTLKHLHLSHVLSENPCILIESGVIESLWESKGYKKLGALFWPDYWKTHADVPVWLLIGTQCRDEWEQEAGQILIDKSKHLDMLLLAEHMLKDWKYWFQISDGDKDVFRYAMLALRKRWALPGRYLGAAGLSWDTLTGFCAHTMLQHDTLGRPIFIHMNLLKQIPSGIRRGTTFKRTRTVNVRLIGNETEIDYGAEADMLANADETGKAIIEAPEPVRRRAALERGLKPFLHGGGNTAICADMKWSDPGLLPTEDVKTWEDPTQIVSWNDDHRLKDFEDRFFDMGGKTNAVGF